MYFPCQTTQPESVHRTTGCNRDKICTNSSRCVDHIASFDVGVHRVFGNPGYQWRRRLYSTLADGTHTDDHQLEFTALGQVIRDSLGDGRLTYEERPSDRCSLPAPSHYIAVEPPTPD